MNKFCFKKLQKFSRSKKEKYITFEVEAQITYRSTILPVLSYILFKFYRKPYGRKSRKLKVIRRLIIAYFLRKQLSAFKKSFTTVLLIERMEGNVMRPIKNQILLIYCSCTSQYFYPELFVIGLRIQIENFSISLRFMVMPMY